MADELDRARDLTEVMHRTIAFARQMIEDTGKPIIDVSLWSPAEDKKVASGYQPVSFPTTDRAVLALSSLVQYRKYLESY